MVIAFQIVLLLVIVLSFLGAIGERDNKALRDNMAMICITGIVAAFASLVWL